jgi:hypothetical protein
VELLFSQALCVSRYTATKLGFRWAHTGDGSINSISAVFIVSMKGGTVWRWRDTDCCEIDATGNVTVARNPSVDFVYALLEAPRTKRIVANNELLVGEAVAVNAEMGIWISLL